jgi:hypothetical protein
VKTLKVDMRAVATVRCVKFIEVPDDLPPERYKEVATMVYDTVPCQEFNDFLEWDGLGEQTDEVPNLPQNCSDGRVTLRDGQARLEIY